MPPALIGGAISAGTSLLGGLLGSNAASKAAAQQAAAGKAAASGQQYAGQQVQNLQTNQIGSERSTASPYLGVGTQGANALSSALGGDLGSRWTSTFSAPTAAQAEAQPGYQFQLQQGIDALQNSAAARGGLLSTGTAKNLNNYAQGVASTNYQNVFNNALQAYNTNFSTNEQSQNDLFNRLYSTTGLGANTAANLNATTAGSTNALASSILGNAQLVGNDIMGVGNAQAAGTVGSANALNAGIGGAGNALSQGISLQGILGALNSSNTYSPFASGGGYSVSAAGLGPTPGIVPTSSYDPGNALLNGDQPTPPNMTNRFGF